jgi:hypothetical protein
VKVQRFRKSREPKLGKVCGGAESYWLGGNLRSATIPIASRKSPERANRRRTARRTIAFYERSSTHTVSEIEHVESRSVPNYRVVEIFFAARALCP